MPVGQGKGSYKSSRKTKSSGYSKARKMGSRGQISNKDRLSRSSGGRTRKSR